MNMANEDDFLSSTYGNDLDAFTLDNVNGFYNSEFEVRVASGINLAFFRSSSTRCRHRVPLASTPERGEEVAISTVESLAQPCINAFAAGEVISGQNIVMDDFTGGAFLVY